MRCVERERGEKKRKEGKRQWIAEIGGDGKERGEKGKAHSYHEGVHMCLGTRQPQPSPALKRDGTRLRPHWRPYNKTRDQLAPGSHQLLFFAASSSLAPPPPQSRESGNRSGPTRPREVVLWPRGLHGKQMARCVLTRAALRCSRSGRRTRGFCRVRVPPALVLEYTPARSSRERLRSGPVTGGKRPSPDSTGAALCFAGRGWPVASEKRGASNI